MRVSAALLVAGLLGAYPAVFAQEGIVGKYTGMMVGTGKAGGPGRHYTVYLVIHKVEAGAVEGTATSGQPGCGDVAVEGRLDGDKLTLRHSAQGEVKQGCGVHWELTVAGNKLEGTTRTGNTLRFSK